MSNTTGWKCPRETEKGCAVILGIPYHPEVCLECITNRHAPKNKRITTDNIKEHV